MKLIKAFFYLVFVLILLAVVVPVLLMIFVNPNQFKPQLQKEVSVALNRPFVIQGDLHWTFYPMAGIKAEGVTMPGLLSVKSLEFSVALQPLLHKDVRIGKILINGLNLTLVKNAQGQANWAALTVSPSPSTPSKKVSSSGDKTSNTTKIAAFSVSQIIIENSQVTLDDATQNKHMKITDFNFKSSDLSMDTAFPVTLSMTMEANNLAMPVEVKLNADLKFLPVSKTLNMTNIHATLNNDLTLTGSDSVVFSSTPTWHANIDLNRINIENMLKLFKQNKLAISGMGNISANLRGAGSTRNLNGDITFAVQNGIFHGIDLYFYGDVADSISNKTAPTSSDTHQTPFGSLTGTAQIRDGVLSNNDLLMKAAKINAMGNGTANLNTEQLDYHLSLQRMTSGAEIKPRGPAIPITITGNFDKPSVKVDYESLAVSQIKQQISDKMKEYAPEINQKIQQGLSSLLGN
ncbi:MAG TPA: AsmA family protein [Gammaproteobacteria bacterium]|nr:AsmA family protein [Gammaproteobacteria bacterium]